MIALVNGRFADGRSGGVLMRGGLILDFGPHIHAHAVPDGAKVIDCAGDLIAPGLVDMQVFVGEPGADYRETLASASRAAMFGGVTSLLTMPNTEPCVDDPAIVDYLRRRANEKAAVRIYPAAALTKGLGGLELSEIGLLQEAGAIAFTDGKKSIQRAGIMRRTMTYAADFDGLVMHFAQDDSLRGDGVMGEGEWASRIGLTGIPWQAETIMLERDIRLVELTGARYHAMAVTNPLSLDVIRRAKAAGLPVTCGVSINHLTLNENDIGGYRTFLKVNPPLPTEDVRKELVAAVASGLIDVIVSDHDPQDVETKRVPFAEAAFGAIGVETLLSAGLRLVASEDIGLSRLLEAMSAAPAKILNLPQGRLAIGAPADLICVDLDAPYVVDALKLQSRAKNSPFDQARLQGIVKQVLVSGRIIHTRADF